MIILRKPATSSANSVFVAGDLLGAKDTSNKTFLTEYEYVRNRISVLYNGVALHSPYDFIQSGSNEITFLTTTPAINDVLKVTYQIAGTVTGLYTDIDLTYSNGVWQSSGSSYTQLPDGMRVYLNGIKQNDEYYTATVNAGKIEVEFYFYTNDSDWASIDAPVLDNQDLAYSLGTWSTSGLSYSEVHPILQVYINGKKEHSDNYTATLNAGDIELVFNLSTSASDWVNIDILDSDPEDADLVYNSGSWETSGSNYIQIPSNVIVYINGIKQSSAYYVVSLNSGKLRVNFDFMTSYSDWVNILIL